MSKPSERGWSTPGVPGSPTGRAYERKHIVTIVVQGRSLRVRREVAPLFLGLFADLAAQGYRIGDGTVVDDWGWAHRWINQLGKPKVGSLSNHAWGLAVDANSLKNPQQRRIRGRKIVQDMPANIVALCTKWGLFWGGLYETVPDPMHFEFLGRPEDIPAIIARNKGLK
jgi:D-alanyl-D-alanine carboxypeptidase